MINRKFPGVCKTIIHISVIIWLSSSGVLALDKDEIVVLANTNASESIGLAKYYMEKRNIPEGHLIKLWMTDKEWCSREEFQEKVIKPVRQYLKEKDGSQKIRCLV
ncbi:MAG: TIGR03790 family protein, partial [Desulfobacula sp.]